METLYTIFHFIVAIGVLVAIHEFGHFWVARKVGVKVLRFSIGFGKVIWSYQKTADSTEYVISAIPLGGYVKMVDEREGHVKEEDLEFAFNRQSLWARAAIVAAGPIFNILLAIGLFWAVFTIGETGMKPIIGEIEAGTIVAESGLREGDLIVAVGEERVPIWTEALNLIFSSAMKGDGEIKVVVNDENDLEKNYFLQVSEEDAQDPETLYKRMGLKPWVPTLKPVIGAVVENGAAQLAGLKKGDLIISADGETISGWMQWVEYVKSRPEITIKLILEREGVHIPLSLTPERVENEKKDFGRIGAGVDFPEEVMNSLRVEYSLPALEGLQAAFKKTWFFSSTTLQMMWQMLIGKASAENLSGPISIAKYAGQSAEMGLVHFLKFLALVSISLGVLNLLPIPVLDGGHLLFIAIEAIKGSPVSEMVQMVFQQVGIIMLLSLMAFAVFLDIGRLF